MDVAVDFAVSTLLKTIPIRKAMACEQECSLEVDIHDDRTSLVNLCLYGK